jgi:hypothetical protein
MATNVQPVEAPKQSASPWRRALLVALVALFVVTSVAAQAVGLTPVAIVLGVAALLTIAPLVNPVGV